MGRGSGRTTKQMKEAPQGSFFVITGRHSHYWMELAKHINRTDLRITSAECVENNSRGHHHPIIIDHAAELSGRVYDYVAQHNIRFKEIA